MRIALILACICGVFSSAAADPVAAYFADRDRTLADICVLKDDGSQQRAYAGVAGKLETQLKAAVPGWKAGGFPEKGQFTIQVPCRNGYGYGVLDGWSYRSGDTTVVVTSVAVLKHWLADHRSWFPRSENPPGDISAALQSEDFYTQAIYTDAHPDFHAPMPVVAPAGTAHVVVEIASLDDGCTFCDAPDRLIAAVVRGDRVFVADEKLKGAMPAVRLCKKDVDYLETKGWSDPISDREKAQRWQQAVRDYRACYVRQIRKQSRYDALQKQAQALVDRLH